MNGGFVYGIDHVNELVYMSRQNIQKNHGGLLDDGRVNLIHQESQVAGLKQFAPYDCIHVGVTLKKLPRELFSFAQCLYCCVHKIKAK